MKRKISLFLLYVIIIAGATVLILSAYLTLKGTGIIKKYEQLIASKNDVADVLTVTGIGIVAIAYVVLSLCNLLSYRADEDCRMHCLPIMAAPIFLIFENGLLHLYDRINCNYYPTMMSVFSATAVGVITFASIKFSFVMSEQRKSAIELSKNKPDITIGKSKTGAYTAIVENSECYLCGMFIGKIDKFKYLDTQKPCNVFKMYKIFFNNIGIKCDIGTSKIDTDYFLQGDKIDLMQYGSAEPDLFFIFRDRLNYYYFVHYTPSDSIHSVYIVSEFIIHRIGKSIKKSRKNKKPPKVKSLDWLNISCSYHN